MEITKKKYGLKVNYLLLFFTGITVLVSAILIYLFILRGVFGRFGMNDLIPSKETIEDLVYGKKPEAAILYSNYTENTLPTGSTWLADNISTWKKFLSNAGLSYDIITDEILENSDLSKYNLLVLPGTKSLSEKQSIKVKKYLEEGGSIFATGGIGSYSEDGKWRGWQFINQTFGIEFTQEIYSSDVYKTHTLRGGFPITANVPTGYPLKVATWDRPMSVEVLDPRTTQLSFWYNYKMEAGLVREEIKKSAGMVYGNYGSGRFVWMGFEVNSVIGTKEDYVYFERIFNNSINWLTYSPIAYIRDWPTGFDAAAVIAPTLTQDEENIYNLFPIISKSNIPVTFFINPELVTTKPKLLKEISEYGEVAVQVDIGFLNSINDSRNKLNSLQEQVDKLSSAKQQVEKVAGRLVTGAVPLYGLFDNNTINAAIGAGYKYLLTDSLTDRSVPKTIIRGENRILTMTKTARDDYEVIRDFGLTLPQFQFYTYQEDLDRILFEGGMYIFKLHSDYQCRQDYINVVSDVIKELKNKKFWIASASEIQSWFEKKDYIEIKAERRGRTRVSIKVSNPGNDQINNLVIDVDLNDNAKNLTLDSEIIGTKPAVIKHTDGSQMLYLYVDQLKAGESRIYYIDYDRENI